MSGKLNEAIDFFVRNADSATSRRDQRGIELQSSFAAIGLAGGFGILAQTSQPPIGRDIAPLCSFTGQWGSAKGMKQRVLDIMKLAGFHKP